MMGEIENDQTEPVIPAENQHLLMATFYASGEVSEGERA